MGLLESMRRNPDAEYGAPMATDLVLYTVTGPIPPRAG